MADAGEFIADAQILELCGTGASATVKAVGWFDKIIVRCEEYYKKNQTNVEKSHCHSQIEC